MVRRFDEPIQVQVAESAGGVAASADPAAFLWRGRVYAVREVDAQWSERRAWWRPGAGAAPSGDTSGASAPVAAVSAGDRRIWRVRAQAGRTGTPGIYELAHDGCAANPWRLVSTHD